MMHFLVIDFHLLEMHRSAYHRIGRWILTGAFLVGWILSTQVTIAPAVLGMLVSFVAGGAVLLIIQDEFAERFDNSYAAFVIAVILYGSLLLVYQD
jgi:fructose-specific phosphotransferase system IIC component